MRNFYRSIHSFAESFQDFLLLALRLIWGYWFLKAGLGKWQDIDSVAAFFDSLHIPFAAANAYAVASIETVGGAMLILGLATRLATIPLICVMTVALLTAHGYAIAALSDDPQGILKEPVFSFWLISVILFAFEGGRISVDYLLGRWIK